MIMRLIYIALAFITVGLSVLAYAQDTGTAHYHALFQFGMSQMRSADRNRYAPV